MCKFIIIGDSYGFRSFLNVSSYFGSEVYIGYVETEYTSVENFKTNENTIVNGSKMVHDTSNQYRRGYINSDLQKYGFELSPYRKSNMDYSDLPDIDTKEYSCILVTEQTNIYMALSLYERYNYELPIVYYNSGMFTELKTYEDIKNSDMIKNGFTKFSLGYNYQYLFGEPLIEYIEGYRNIVNKILKDCIDKFLSGGYNKFIREAVRIYYSDASIASSISGQILQLIDSDLYSEDELSSINNRINDEIRCNVLTPIENELIAADRIAKAGANSYFHCGSIVKNDELLNLIIENNLQYFKTRSQTIKELRRLLRSFSDNKYTLDEAQSKAILKIINRNKANKDLKSVIEKAIYVFSDSINWEELDDLIRDVVFTTKTVIGKYTIGGDKIEENSEEEDNYTPQLESVSDFINGFAGKSYYDSITSPALTLSFIIFADDSEVCPHLRQLSAALFDYMCSNYTSTGGTDWTLRRSIEMFKTKDGKIIKDKNLKKILDRVFKIVQNDKRKIIYKKFHYMVTNLGVDYLCKDELYSNDKTYKKVRMEMKISN